MDAMDTPHAMENDNTPPSRLQSLPAELLDLILLWSARLEASKKNDFLERRLVCRAFDKAIRPLVCKAIQLEASMFNRSATKPQIQYLEPMGYLCEALYLDVMIVRDEEEASSLANAFRGLSPSAIPEMETLFGAFRQYCMGEHNFDEMDLRSMLETVIDNIPNLKRFRMNLPVQVVGISSSTSTLLLATALSILANRPEEHKPLETLVIDHLTDTTINRLCYNHMDLKNCLRVFSSLKYIALSLKKNESFMGRAAFTRNLWLLLRQAVDLESLCLVGWSSGSTLSRLRLSSATYPEWSLRCLPYVMEGLPKFKNLRNLELKRVDVVATALINIISEASQTLKEIYLIGVYLKINSALDGAGGSRWIGQLGNEKDEKACWVAHSLRHMEGLKLEILRATGLGYDDYEQHPLSPDTDYDFNDPTPFSRSFDQRFVEAVMGPGLGVRKENHQTTRSLVNTNASQKLKSDYDAELYQLTVNDPTSHYKLNIDGLFMNHNEKAMKELGLFMSIADRIMKLITDWISRVRTNPRVVQTDATLVGAPLPDGSLSVTLPTAPPPPNSNVNNPAVPGAAPTITADLTDNQTGASGTALS